MGLDAYQAECRKTAIYPTDNSIPYLALALCGEAGEAADKVKKVMRDKEGRFFKTDTEAIALELGDTLYYLASLAHVLGYRLSDIARLNLEKIQSRLDRGTLHGSGDNR